MNEEITRLSTVLADRMRELRADPTDPRLAPLFAQYQALVRQHMATATPATPIAALCCAKSLSCPGRASEEPGPRSGRS